MSKVDYYDLGAFREIGVEIGPTRCKRSIEAVGENVLEALGRSLEGTNRLGLNALLHAQLERSFFHQIDLAAEHPGQVEFHAGDVEDGNAARVVEGREQVYIGRGPPGRPEL